jgi:hypothetical protein
MNRQLDLFDNKYGCLGQDRGGFPCCQSCVDDFGTGNLQGVDMNTFACCNHNYLRGVLPSIFDNEILEIDDELI